jgi:rhodanese-related sulfurtransferase
MTRLINRNDLLALINANSVTVVDALPASYYNQQHLPGAVNLVEDDVTVLADVVLPDRSATVVTYCSNVACGNSKAVAARLEKLGYTDVRTYREGIQDWVESGLPVEGVVAAGH